MAKKFDYGKGVYYFNIRTGGHNSITINRRNKNEAELTYLNYRKIGKECEWLGKWEGKKFVETSTPQAAKQ